jgi:outer membrane biosynthesis protein TonB
VVPENRLPPSMRLAEVNVQANRTIPDKTDFIAAKNQSAAQPVPEKIKTNSSLPKSLGDSPDAIKVSQGRPRSVEESDLTDVSSEAEKLSTGLQGKSPQKSSSEPKKTSQHNSTPVRPRATIPSGTTGILLKNNIGVNRAGAIAVDAKFSNYGDYSQRMMEAIQSSWWALIERARFESVSRGSVVIRFNLCRDGSVINAEILHSDVPQVMALACKDAVMAPRTL